MTSYEQAKEIAKKDLWSFRHYNELRLEGGTQCDFELEEVDYVEDETGYLYHHIAVYGLSKEDFKHFAKWFFGAINMLNDKAKKRDEINYDNDDYDDEEEITLTDEEFKLVDEAADRAFLEWKREMELKEEEKRKEEEERRRRAEERLRAEEECRRRREEEEIQFWNHMKKIAEDNGFHVSSDELHAAWTCAMLEDDSMECPLVRRMNIGPLVDFFKKKYKVVTLYGIIPDIYHVLNER